MVAASFPPKAPVANTRLCDSVTGTDPEVAAAIVHERMRQQRQIELIASENFVSRAVLEAQGSVLTNKYAEGYPGRRYYGGCEFVDVVETLAIERARRLFGCAYANVQPHSGAQANQAAFMALLQPGDTILGMALDRTSRANGLTRSPTVSSPLTGASTLMKWQLSRRRIGRN